MIVLASALLLFAPAEVTPEAFGKLVAAASLSDAAVPAALDALGRAALQRGFRLEAYQRAAGKFDFATDVRRLQVVRARQGDREVVAVTMGFFSKLVGRDARGDLAFPKSFALVRQYEASPRFVGKGLLVDGAGIQDAGVRYGYRLAFLAPSARGFELKREWKGVWNLGDAPESHAEVKGTTLTLSTLDESKTFFAANVARLLPTITTWDLRSTTPRLLRTRQLEPELRAVDNWIAATYAVKTPNRTQAKFRADWGEMRTMLADWKVEKGSQGADVMLENGDRFRFRVTRNGMVKFLGVTKG